MNKRYVLITGASSGIGKELAKIFAKDGFSLILSARSMQNLEIIKQELSMKSDVMIIQSDLTLDEDLEKLKNVIHNYKPIIVINCAGIGLYGRAIDHNIQDQINIYRLNVHALTFITLAAVKVLDETNRQGVVMNISSAAAFFPFPFFSIYSASKAYVNQFSLSLDAEMKEKGIRILCCCPGQVATNFREKASLGSSKNSQDFRTMSALKAAKLIRKQIEKKKDLNIIDFRYKVWLFLARFLIPKTFLQKLLKKEISTRISS